MTHASLSESHRLAIRLLRSYHQVDTLGRYLAFLSGVSEEHILSIDNAAAKELLRDAIVGYTEELHDAVQISSMAKGKGRASDVTCAGGTSQVVTEAQTRIFAANRGVKGAPKNMLTLGVSGTLDYDAAPAFGPAPYVQTAANTVVESLVASEAFASILEHVGPAVLIDLLASASLYLPLRSGPHVNYLQVAGPALFDMAPPAQLAAPTKRRRESDASPPDPIPRPPIPGAKRKLKEMVFPRMLMFHRWPERDKRNKFVAGLPAEHILMRLPSIDPPFSTPYHAAIHLSKYIFPLAYRLDNIFYAPFVVQGVGKMLPEWLDRDNEIRKRGAMKTPDRLKPLCAPEGLVGKIASRSCGVNGTKLLDRHCPSRINKADLQPLDAETYLSLSVPPPDEQPITQDGEDLSLEASHPSLVVPHGHQEAEAAEREKPHAFDYAVPTHLIEAYIWSMISAWGLFGWWGSKENEKLVRTRIRQIINLRRFETLTMHDLLQDFSICDCDWLIPANKRAQAQRVTPTDDMKRREILHEWVWWFYVGFVASILKTTFYITETSGLRNRVLHFRQDDWYDLCQPALRKLREVHFTLVPKHELENGKLGHSYVRLLPKQTGVRPIVNLRRRTKRVHSAVSRSINQMLQDLFAALIFEKTRGPDRMGSSVLGPNDIYVKLKRFKHSLGSRRPKFYFVKVDIRACFDTIEHGKLLDVIEGVLQESTYTMQRYSTVAPTTERISKKFHRTACPKSEDRSFTTVASKLAEGIRNTVFSDQVHYLPADRAELLELLREHIQDNRVKIGKEVYRQKLGIAQGSVVSALLCSLFYGDMEKEKLDFTRDPSSLLIRLIDDFLFVTPSRALATQFLETMNASHPEYGCYISAEKSLTNFVVSVESSNGKGDASDMVMVPRVKSSEFPWCGYLIDTRSLDIRVDYSRTENLHLGDGLTIDYTKSGGCVFRTKMLVAARLRAHNLLTDTKLNSLDTVYLNVYQAALVLAMKFVGHIKAWGGETEKRAGFLFGVLQDSINYMHVVSQNRAMTKLAVSNGGACDVRRHHVLWLGRHAFERVLSRRSTRFRTILELLRSSMAAAKDPDSVRRRLRRIVDDPSNRVLDGLRF